jgi:hypothetical protein
MGSRQLRKPRQSEPRIRRGEAWTLVAMGGAMFLVGLSGLAYVAGSLWAGVFDARPKGSPRDAPPVFVYASDDPVEFYGSMVFLALLAGGLLVIGIGIAQDAISESRGGNAEPKLGTRLRRRGR